MIIPSDISPDMFGTRSYTTLTSPLIGQQLDIIIEKYHTATGHAQFSNSFVQESKQTERSHA